MQRKNGNILDRESGPGQSPSDEMGDREEVGKAQEHSVGLEESR